MMPKRSGQAALPHGFPEDLRHLQPGDPNALRDLTRLYLKALESQRAKDGLLAVAAHELRHPLHVMRLALYRYLPHDESARAGLDRYIQRMERLIEDLIDFIRTEQNALELRQERVDLRQLVADVVNDYRSLFEQRRIRLTVTAPGRVHVSADAHRLIQVLSNLLDNALKFTPGGGVVTVETVARGREAVLRVRDNGRGLSADALSHALDMPVTLSSAQGLGIGLSVARRIVELHGGTMRLESDGPGRGTEAVVVMPLDR